MVSERSHLRRAYGVTSFSKSHFISWGTPGSAKTTPFSCSTMNDGAVPLGFSTGMAPSGMSA